MSARTPPFAHETQPVGRTKEDQERNAELLSGYDYDQYTTALTGFTGQDLQRIGFVQWQPAVRTRVGPRGNYKSGLARRPDGALVLAVCRDNNDSDATKRQFLISVHESRDMGLTWREIGQTELRGKEPALTALPDGSLILMAQSGYFGPGARQDEHPLARSRDGGRTWDLDRTIRLHTSNGYYVGWAVTLLLPDGSLITSYAATTYARQPPDKFTAEVVRWRIPENA